MQEVIEVAPIILIVIVFIVQYNIFVTPKQVADMKASILEEVENKFVNKEIVEEIKKDIQRIETKLDNLIDYLMKK